MAQVIAITASSGIAGTVAKLFAEANSDVVVATASSVLEGANRLSTYVCTFTGVAVGVYELLLVDGEGLPLAKRWVKIDAADGYWPDRDVLVEDVEDAAQSVIEHGDDPEAGNWGATGGGSSGGGTNGTGQYAITVTATSSGNGVAGVRVSIVASTTHDYTGTNGVATLNVDPGDYVLRFTVPDNYEPVNDYAIDDLDDEVAVPITLVARSYPSSPVAGTCEVADFVFESDGRTPVIGASVRAIASSDAKLSEIGIISAVITTAITSSDGRFVLRLPQKQSISIGKRYTIEAKKDARVIYKVLGYVPNQSQCTLREFELEEEDDD